MSTTTKPGAEAAITRDPRWARVMARDKSADGSFWYSVATTGVYCRPSCASRPANPLNVRLHTTIDAARAAGFRACRRCNPDGLPVAAENAAIIARVCRLIEQADPIPPLAALAQAADLSPGYFHRLFKSATGVTPKAYGDERRAARVRQQLAGDEATVTAAMYEAGYGSSGGFYSKSNAVLGMTPSRLRSGGAGEVLRFAVGTCSLGSVLVASSPKGVAAILLGDDPAALLRELQDRFPAAHLVGGDADYEALIAKVIGAIDSSSPTFELPLDVRGTAFQQRVWRVLRAIPAGTTLSYAEVAARIGAPRAVRAVAGACASNPLAIVIPCHRVVRTDGAPSGYRWGLERKRTLIEREAAAREGHERRDQRADRAAATP